jgi:hypothetical protein
MLADADKGDACAELGNEALDLFDHGRLGGKSLASDNECLWTLDSERLDNLGQSVERPLAIENALDWPVVT